MDQTPLLKLYERLITGALPIEPSIQRHIVEHLVRTKKFSLLGRLASRTDLSSETDAAIAKRKEAVVVAGWASRPGLTTQELLDRLAKDTRVATLLPLTTLQGLPEEVYATLMSRDSVKLTAALMGNPSVSTAVKLTYIDNIVRVLDGTKYWHLTEAIVTCARGDESILRAIISHSGKPDVVVAALAVCSEPPVGWIESCMSRIDTLMEIEVSQGVTYHRGGESLLDVLAYQDLTDEQLKKLRSLANVLVKKSAEQNTTSYSSRSYDDAKKMLSPKGRGIVADIQRLKTSIDAQESVHLVNKLLPKKSSARANILVGEKFYERYVLNVLPYNEVLPVAVVKPFVDELDDSTDMPRLMLNWAKRGELDAIAQCAAESWSAPSWLVDLPDPLAIMKAVVKYVLDKEEDVPRWMLSHPMVLASPDTALALLPWKWLSSVSENIWGEQLADETSSARADALVHAAQAMISSRLKDDSRKWEAFTMLSNEFNGPLPTLLDTVELI